MDKSTKQKASSRESKLLKASKHGDLDMVKYCLQKQVNINCQTKHGVRLGWTALHRACFYGHLKIVKFLIKHNALILDENNASMLHVACSSVNKKMVQHLLSTNFSPTLIDLDYNSPLHILVKHGHTKDINDVLEIAQLLLTKGGNVNIVNKNGFTALHIAVNCTAFYNSNDLFALCRFFLNNQADIKQLVCNENEKYCHHNSLFHIAINSVRNNIPGPLLHKCFKICEFLIDNGIKINHKNSMGNTPLHEACDTGNLLVVRLLLHNNVALNIRNNDGLLPTEIMTPLSWNTTFTSGDYLDIQEGEQYSDIQHVISHKKHEIFCHLYLWLKETWVLH
jgi:ankyrin repeat protein